MTEHIRVDYASLEPEMDDIAALAADSGRPVVLQEPPSLVKFNDPDGPLERFERHTQKKISRRAAATAEGFETLLEHLEEQEIPVWVSESTEPLEELDAAEEAVSGWERTDSVALFVSATLFMLSYPLQALLRTAHRISGWSIFVRLEDRIGYSAFVHRGLREFLREGQQRDEDHLQDQIALVREETGKEPLVVTSREFNLP